MTLTKTFSAVKVPEGVPEVDGFLLLLRGRQAASRSDLHGRAINCDQEAQ